MVSFRDFPESSSLSLHISQPAQISSRAGLRRVEEILKISLSCIRVPSAMSPRAVIVRRSS